MKRAVCLTIGVLLLATACASPTPTSLPPTVGNTAPTGVAATSDPQTIPLPTLLPTVAIQGGQPTLAPVPGQTVVPVTLPPSSPIPITATSAAAAPRPSATAAPVGTATPFPEGLPKVYVTALRVEPATPKPDTGGTFFVTFNNASGEERGYNWAVEIWDADNDRRPFGLTTPQNSPMPIGVSNYTSTGWTVKGLGECHTYRARVVSRDDDDNRATFIQPDGSILWITFNVCP